MSAAAYLQSLNTGQRLPSNMASSSRHQYCRASPGHRGRRLRKDQYVAHRAAHLIVNGVNPGRILLLTFSRRAAAEMERRAERIIKAAVGQTTHRAYRLVRNVSRRRCAPVAELRPSHRPRSIVHHS